MEAREANFARIVRRFDPSNTGYVSWSAFQFAGASWAVRRHRGLIRRFGAWALENRVYIVFVLWLAMGVVWGVKAQGWDVITAGHFAVSALATGGLTAPPVDAQGIMPRDDALFVGTYCLFGIPLFALMLSKAARFFVESHVLEAEARSVATPMRRSEFELAKSLCTPDDNRVHLSDFLVLHLLRQGKMSIESIRLLRTQFELLDRDAMGALTLDQACSEPGGPVPMSSGRCTWPDV